MDEHTMRRRTMHHGGRATLTRLRHILVLVLLAALTLSACGNDNQTAVQPTAEPVVSSPLPTAEEPDLDTTAEVLEPTEVITIDPNEEMTPEPATEATVEATPDLPAVATPEAQNITLAEISADPAMYYGTIVSVEGGVNVVKDEHAFTIAENTATDAGEVLVVDASAETLDQAIREEARVRVTGEIRSFILTDVEQRLNMDINDDAYIEHANKPVIFASSMEVIDESADANQDADAGLDPDLAEFGRNITVAEVVGNLDRFIGKRVVLREEVEAVINANAFTFDEDAPLEGGIDSDLLVLTSAPGTDAVSSLAEGEQVRAIGTVRRFNLQEVEQELGADLVDDLFTDWNERPVLIASVVEPDPEVSDVADPDATIEPMDPALTDEFGGTITVAEIAGNPDRFMGQRVTVREEIEEVIAPGVFSLDEDALLAGGIDNDLLVIAPVSGITNTGVMTGTPEPDMTTTPEPDMTTTPGMTTLVTEGMEGRIVRVNGTVQQFVTAEIEREYGLDLDDELVVDFESRPVLIASSVRLIDDAWDVNDTDTEANMTEPTVTESFGTNVTVADITGNLAAYDNQQVAVRGEVEETFGNAAFSIDEDAALDGGIDNELLVLGANEAMPFTATELEGKAAIVHGTVRSFDLQVFEQELGYDLDDTVFQDWAGRPAIIASTVDLQE